MLCCWEARLASWWKVSLQQRDFPAPGALQKAGHELQTPSEEPDREGLPGMMLPIRGEGCGNGMLGISQPSKVQSKQNERLHGPGKELISASLVMLQLSPQISSEQWNIIEYSYNSKKKIAYVLLSC